MREGEFAHAWAVRRFYRPEVMALSANVSKKILSRCCRAIDKLFHMRIQQGSSITDGYPPLLGHFAQFVTCCFLMENCKV
ncbi:hypothetical protein MO867_07795 [Microbulbifer sp. OS29]|uniref:Uncharacterized protein n=1 Tax=Microbulbifer okhotskensis TaxID=2926617 RepID=A0A9X2J642_9GAMM|nr:hypothetical protein [Microbulbifer okhotskensis]MCO1334245.1 hypothetical protein [Microbulbifer okhotskensis]